MSNILDNLKKEDTVYTVFENDQVLTADQLNDLFRYLDVQTRLTRTRMIGVGIVCGLEVDVNFGNITVGKGTAITTDGDLIHFDSDQNFDQFVEFKDENAQYPFFRIDETVIPMFQLVKKSDNNKRAVPVLKFESTVNDALNNFVAVLYVEDYNHDPDLCTGTDCDNKGCEHVRDTKVLLISKNDIKILLQSVPKINSDYFSMQLMDVPRVIIDPTTNQNSELRKAFTNTFTAIETLKRNLKVAYNSCKALIDDELQSTGIDAVWNKALDNQFGNVPVNGYQYLYDYMRDLCMAYNELVENFFGDNVMCCPDVNLFPKHALLGTVGSASKRTLRPQLIDTPTNFPGRENLLPELFFWKRFSRFNIDIEYRHQFYESPILNSKNEITERAKFLSLRINSMIQNFSIPEGKEIRITPSRLVASTLGERAIPYYYQFDASTPINFHWNYDAHVRRKENRIQYYYASRYPDAGATVLNPLQFDLSANDFFRIEGHIGMNFQQAESQLETFIRNNNLPIRVISVQIENDPRFIVPRPWKFPHLEILDHVMRNDLMDHLHEINNIHTQLDKTDAFVSVDGVDHTQNVREATNGFKTHFSNLIGHLAKPVAEMNVESLHKDLTNAVSAATTVKTNMKQFSFTQTTPAHDLLINTNIHRSLSHISDLITQQIEQKKNELLFANFLAANPGMEHMAGTVRGGTFVLVYSSEPNNLNNVIADFMLPYNYIDNDVKPPLQLKPLPLPLPKFEIPRLFDKRPFFDDVIKLKALDLDNRINRFEEKFTVTNTMFDGIIKGSNIFNPEIFKLKAGILEGGLLGGRIIAGEDVTNNLGLMENLAAGIKGLKDKGIPEEDPRIQRMKETMLDVAKETTLQIGASQMNFDDKAVASQQLGQVLEQANTIVPELKTNLTEHLSANIANNKISNQNFIQFMGGRGFGR